MARIKALISNIRKVRMETYPNRKTAAGAMKNLRKQGLRGKSLRKRIESVHSRIQKRSGI